MGFFSFLLLTYRTYELGTVNEGLTVALGKINTAPSTAWTTFDEVTSHLTLIKFLRTNLLKNVDAAEDSDFNSYQDDKSNGHKLHLSARSLPVTFLPITLEQTRHEHAPLCNHYKENKKFVIAVEGNCEKEYLDLHKYGDQLVQDAETSKVTGVFCPAFDGIDFPKNMSYNPFEKVKSTLVLPECMPGTKNVGCGARKEVYQVRNLSPKPEDQGGKSMTQMLEILNGCRWIDLQTKEVLISVPFLVKASGVQGEIRYTVQFSTSGEASTTYKVSYAKHIQTSGEYYAQLSHSDPNISSMAMGSLVCRIYMTVYLIAEIYMRNQVQFKAALKMDLGADKEGEAPTPMWKKKGKKCMYVTKTLFPGATEFLGFGLLVSSLIIPVFYDAINTEMKFNEETLTSIGSGKLLWNTPTEDGTVTSTFLDHMMYAQQNMFRTNSIIVIVCSMWLLKLMILFSVTDDVNVVPHTLIKSLPPIFNLMIVISTMVTTFAAMAMVCYGHVLSRWTKPALMMLEVYRMMLGDYGDQYIEMYNEDKTIAIILFLFFSVVLMMTVVNIFMSVVLDTYAEVNNDEYKETVRRKAEAALAARESVSIAPPQQQNTKKANLCRKCFRMCTCCCRKLPKKGSKWLLIPHLLGFFAFMLVIFNTYKLSEVNEGLSTAKGYISTTEMNGVKTFEKISSVEDVYTFLTKNVIPNMHEGWNSDYMGRNYLPLDSDLYTPQNFLPILFLPFSIEQTRRLSPGVCKDYKDSTSEEDQNFMKGFGADCKVITGRKFGELPIPDKNYTTVASCPFFKEKKGTDHEIKPDPFTLTESFLELPEQVYMIENVAYYSKPYNDGSPEDHSQGTITATMVVNALKECYWIDLQTKQIFINIPFAVKGSMVFGSLQYRIDFTESGKPTLGSTMYYARTIDTATGAISSLCSAYILIYLCVELVLRNFIKISTAFKAKKPCCKKLKGIILSFFPGVPEYLSMTLLASQSGFPIIIGMVNTRVAEIVSQFDKVADGVGNPGDPAFMKDFNGYVKAALHEQQGLNGYTMFIMVLFLVKMLYVFYDTDGVSVVPRTLVRSLFPIFNLLIVIIAMVASFAGMAMVCYGHSFARWTNPFLMLLEVYQMMLGDWGEQYNEMYNQDRLLAIILFLFFSIVLMMTMINIFLSVVLDTYAAINEEEAKKAKENGSEQSGPSVSVKVAPAPTPAPSQPVVPEKSVDLDDPLGNVGDRLRITRQQYGAGSDEYKSVMEEASNLKNDQLRQEEDAGKGGEGGDPKPNEEKGDSPV
jgi:hypothetical protein